MSKKMFDVIIGMGEIGKGLYKIAYNSGRIVYGLDLDIEGRQLEVQDMGDSGTVGKYSASLDDIAKCTKVLHICIPGNIDNFVPIVAGYIEVFSPEVTIVHSTVPVGTTTKLNEVGVVAHSPVRGKHPDMDIGLLNYVKYVGMPKDISIGHWKTILNTFKDYGIVVRTMDSPEATELAKILSTTRYGINLLLADAQNEIVEKLGLNYTQVVVEWEQTYNEGLEKVGLGRYRRPILTPPKGYIGGHCVYENAEMLLHNKPELSLLNVFLKLIKYFGRIGKNDTKDS